VKVRFPRLTDGHPAYCVVERSDGVRYRVREGVCGPQIPHDLVHFIVERETGEDGGFWGAVAAGAVFTSMEHLAGRRPPHAADRSTAAIRARSGRLQRAELMADLVTRVADRGTVTAQDVLGLAREVLSTLPDAEVNAQRVVAAAEVLRRTADHWATLAPGDELVVDWPRTRRRRL
jgi:hypothetical protein